MIGHLDVLEAAHASARMIHIVRDGRAVAASLKEKFKGPRLTLATTTS